MMMGSDGWWVRLISPAERGPRWGWELFWGEDMVLASSDYGQPTWEDALAEARLVWIRLVQHPNWEN